MSNSRTKQKQLNRSIGMIPPADSAGTAGTGVTASEEGDGRTHTTVLTVAATDALTVADNAALSDGHLVYTFPAGEIIIESAYMSMGVTLAEDTTQAAAEIGLGTTAGTGAAATLGAVAATAENILGPATPTACDGTATVTTAAVGAGTPLVIATAGAHTVYFNIAATWADTAGADLTGDIAGTITLCWKKMS